MKPVDIIIVLILAVLFLLAAAKTVKKFKGGGCCGCSGCSGGSCSSCGNRSIPDPSEYIGGGELLVGVKTVKIKGMHCEHCRESVEKALNSIEGIKASVDLKNNEARVICEAVDENLIKDAVQGLGFTVESIV